MESFFQDVRFAVRSLIKTPSFTVIATLCLAFGIATNTTLFSVFDAIVIRPLPFDHPNQLVTLVERDPRNDNTNGIAYPSYKDWKEQSKSAVAMGAWTGRQVAITEGEEPERLNAQLVTASLFPMLGIQAQIGRVFRDDDDQLGARGVVLLGDGVWRRRYGADSLVVGRVISINNDAYTVIGVMPPRFMFPERSELWLPAGPLMGRDGRNARALRVVARLKPGATLAQADQEMAGIVARIDEANGIDPKLYVGAAHSFESDFVSKDVRAIVTTMYGAVTFVLLIAIANIANLLLTRAAARQREIAIRAAIGAGRGRIIRQLVTEAVVLGLGAGALAIPLSWIGLKLIDRGIPPEDPAPYWMHWSLDTTTLVYTAVVAVGAGILFGMAPALQALRGDVFGSLKDRGRGDCGGKSRLRNGLVILEVALSFVLLVGAALFTRSFSQLQRAQVGFNTSPILTMRMYLPGTAYDSARPRIQRVQDIVSRVEQVPGVESATISNLLPIDGGGSGGPVIVDGHPVEPGKEPNISWTGVTGHWFAALGNTVGNGRAFGESESHDSAAVAVINLTMAKKLWPAGAALGERFRLAGDSSHTWLTVIGIAPDIRAEQLSDDAPPPMLAYLPYQFLPTRGNALIVRAHGNPATLAGAVRAAVRASDPTVPVFRIQTMDKVRELSFWQNALFGWMFGIFGIIALFLAAIGVYGVISYGVSQRTHEIGVRVALGAQRGDVLRLVMRHGIILVGVGILIGLVGAFGVTRVISSFLIGISATDPVSFIGVALFLGLVATVASLIPARRATGVDPMIAMRAD